MLVLLAVITTLGGWAVWAGLSARTDLLEAQRLLSSASEQPDDLDSASTLLETASVHTTRARGRLSAPGPAVVAAVPVLGRSLAAERDVANAADALVQAARGAVPVLRDVGSVNGQIDPAALQRVSLALDEAAGRARGPARRLSQTPTAFTPGAVGSAVAEARAVLLPAADVL